MAAVGATGAKARQAMKARRDHPDRKEIPEAHRDLKGTMALKAHKGLRGQRVRKAPKARQDRKEIPVAQWVRQGTMARPDRQARKVPLAR